MNNTKDNYDFTYSEHGLLFEYKKKDGKIFINVEPYGGPADTYWQIGEATNSEMARNVIQTYLFAHQLSDPHSAMRRRLRDADYHAGETNAVGNQRDA